MAESWGIADAVKQHALQNYVDGAMNDDIKTMHLFKNDYTPDDNSVLSDFTEADFVGYVAQTVPNGTWSTVAVVAHVAKTVNGTTITFDADSTATAQTIYGYYYTNVDDEYAGAQRFDTPVVMHANESLDVIPEIDLLTLPN